jgi:hypothetical protein
MKLQGPEVIAGLHATVGRMCLISSREVIRIAENVVRLAVDT